MGEIDPFLAGIIAEKDEGTRKVLCAILLRSAKKLPKGKYGKALKKQGASRINVKTGFELDFAPCCRCDFSRTIQLFVRLKSHLQVIFGLLRKIG